MRSAPKNASLCFSSCILSRSVTIHCSAARFPISVQQPLSLTHRVVSPLSNSITRQFLFHTMSTGGLKRKSDGLPTPDAKKPKADGSIMAFFGTPKPPAKPAANKVATDSVPPSSSPGGDGEGKSSSTPSKSAATPAGTLPFASSTTSKFDKEKWVASLSEEEKQLLSLEINTLDESWLALLKDDVRKPSFLNLKRFLKKEAESKKKIFPPPEDVYSWSRHTPFNTVKVVILGQDPYHNDNQAHGLCFSVRPPTIAPPSLKNIYTAIAKDYPSFQPPPNRGGLLTPWANQGVLMLNTVLTVRAHDANSHKNQGWEQFTRRVIELVNTKRTRGVVFLAWGSPAKTAVAPVDKKRHHVLYAVHPSPLSAARGWFECGHFRKANDWLKGRYGDEGVVDWSLDVAPEKAGV